MIIVPMIHACSKEIKFQDEMRQEIEDITFEKECMITHTQLLASTTTLQLRILSTTDLVWSAIMLVEKNELRAASKCQTLVGFPLHKNVTGIICQ